MDILKLRFEFPFGHLLLFHTLCQIPIEEIKELVKRFCHAELTTGDIEVWQYHVNRYIDDPEVLKALREEKKLSKTLLSKVMAKYGLKEICNFNPSKGSDLYDAYKIASSDEHLILNILSIKGLSLEEIVKLYGAHYNAVKTISVETIKLYYYYFWDVSNMDSADWAHLLPKLESEKYYHLSMKGNLNFVKWLLGLPCEETDILQLIQRNLKYLSYLLGTEGE